jgi:hypothetical protein
MAWDDSKSGVGATLTGQEWNDHRDYIKSVISSSATISSAATFPTSVASLTGTQTFTNKTLTSPKIGTAIFDTSGNELIALTATGSAVNEITLANAATNNPPTLSATGGDTNISVLLSPKGAGSWYGNREVMIIALSDETTAITTGTAKITFHMPYNFKLLQVKAGLTTASSSGNPAFDLNDDGASVFSTTITIDANETFSDTAATPSALTGTPLSIASGSVMTIDVDTAGTGAKGAKLYLIGYAY